MFARTGTVPRFIYRIRDSKMDILLVPKRKVVCTGARHSSNVEKAVERVTADLKANGLLR